MKSFMLVEKKEIVKFNKSYLSYTTVSKEVTNNFALPL